MVLWDRSYEPVNPMAEFSMAILTLLFAAVMLVAAVVSAGPELEPLNLQ